jgi:hypothetical protein
VILPCTWNSSPTAQTTLLICSLYTHASQRDLPLTKTLISKGTQCALYQSAKKSLQAAEHGRSSRRCPSRCSSFALWKKTVQTVVSLFTPSLPLLLAPLPQALPPPKLMPSSLSPPPFPLAEQKGNKAGTAQGRQRGEHVVTGCRHSAGRRGFICK